MKSKSKNIIAILTTSLLTGVILYLLVGRLFQGKVDNLVANLAPFNKMPPKSIVSSSLDFEFVTDTNDCILVERMKNPSMKFTAANQREEALLDEVSDISDLESHMSSFAHSPNREIISPTSYARKERLLRKEAFNGLSWYSVDGEVLLYQDSKPYTGWCDIQYFEGDYDGNTFTGWDYYIDGYKKEEYHISASEVSDLMQRNHVITKLCPPLSYRLPIYITSPKLYNGMAQRKNVSYSIIYQAEDEVILTSPPGTRNSRLVGPSSEYYNLPMEVLQEVETTYGVWLHVNLGYEELGWIKKDEAETDYFETTYSERELLDRINEAIAYELDNIAADTGASFVNHDTLAHTNVNNHIFFPASTQKIYVLAEIYHQYKTGELSPYDVYAIEAHNIVPGAGIIQEQPVGTLYSVDELVDLVAIYSDNTAANTLIDIVGGADVLTPHMHQIGLFDTYINSKYYAFDGGLFYTTPENAARLFAMIYRDQLNGDPWDTELVLKFYLNGHNFLRQYIPASTKAWNKSGLGETEQNDVASFSTPYGSYSLAVFTAYPANYNAIAEQLGRLGLIVHDVYLEYRSQYPIFYNE